MTDLRATALLPFIPSGSDYDASRRQFADLGFEEIWENDGLAGFRCGDAGFILQRYDVTGFAENLMMALDVPDLDAWWSVVSARQLETKYPGLRLGAPSERPWGREATLIDLAGVCWHVRQAEPSTARRTVDRYMEAFRRGDHDGVLDCLTDDVEWLVPGAFHARGKRAFDSEIENENFIGRPEITVTRTVESPGVVAAEGTVRTQRKDGEFLDLTFWDVFDIDGGKIRRLTSYLAPVVGENRR